ncbi:MAG TPA: hypothetical protein VD763_02695 [Candidatus Saccharimonadales bacterium]|nr:hypothetical protein [Candidatus Saccharimonadales bacterium]
MHIQARSKAKLSPADLSEFLGVMAQPTTDGGRINIEGVTGSEIEIGQGDKDDTGWFNFSMDDTKVAECHRILTAAKYRPEYCVDLYSEAIPVDQAPDPNQPGVLHQIILNAKKWDGDRRRPIDTVLIGALTDQPGHFYVQVTFVGSAWTSEPPPDEEPDLVDG